MEVLLTCYEASLNIRCIPIISSPCFPQNLSSFAESLFPLSYMCFYSFFIIEFVLFSQYKNNIKREI